jgi:hypothetical protein
MRKRKIDSLFFYIFHIIIFSVFMFVSPRALVGDGSSEEQTKATLFLKVPLYLQWPVESGIYDPNKPFIMCVIDSNPFDRYLYDFTRDKLVLGKKVRLFYVREITQIPPGCNLLFITDVGRNKFREILDYVASKPIVTVGDTDGYIAQGVFFNIVMEAFSEAYSLDFNEVAARKSGFILKTKQATNLKIIVSYEDYQKNVASGMERWIEYIRWPGENNSSEPFYIDVFGDDSYFQIMKDMYKNKKFKNRKVITRSASRLEEIEGSQLVFIGESRRNELSRIISFLKKKKIFITSDTEGFAEQGVHLNFIFKDGKFIYEINPSAAKENGLQVSYLSQTSSSVRVVNSDSRK